MSLTRFAQIDFIFIYLTLLTAWC